MKSNYVVRAKKFMMSIVPYLEKYDDIRVAVHKYNLDKHRHVEYYHGIARRCLCLADYAVKWDYDVRQAKTFGGCEDEVTNYQFACDHGYEYLFAEITRVEVMGHVFYVMPRVRKLAVTTDDYSPDRHLTSDEYDFIYEEMGLHDLHDENWGFINGKVTIIDYACYRRE